MTDIGAFDRALDGQMKELQKVIIQKHGRLVTLTYNQIVDTSPIFSGYYGSNHRINLDGGSEMTRVPAKKDAEAVPGQYVAFIETTRQTEMDKVKGLSASQVLVKIGTSVDYADDIEIRRGVYNNAVLVAIAKFNSERA